MRHLLGHGLLVVRPLAVGLLAIGLLAFLLARPAAADQIKLVVPFAAGGPVDLIARTLAAELGPRLNGEVIVENRGGAGGVIGTELVAKSPPDGKTLLLASLGSHVLSAALRPQLGYDPVKSFVPIVYVGAVPSLLVVAARSPIASFDALIARARATTLSYGSAGPGTTMNIAGELMNATVGIKTTHVPYRGAGPALNDFLGGHLDLMVADTTVLLPLVDSGSVRPLALFAPRRSPLLPDVPTTAELGYPQIVMENWYGVLAPAGLPAPLRASLEKAVLDVIAAPSVKERFDAGGLTAPIGGAGFAARLAADVAYWGRAVKTLGISTE
jgi:tripartite-type tricarboxylate transporter receptor subunit TctC